MGLLLSLKVKILSRCFRANWLKLDMPLDTFPTGGLYFSKFGLDGAQVSDESEA